MYNIFNEAGKRNTVQYHWPEFDLVRRTYLKELYQIQTYYHNRVYAVKSNHFLVYLLNALSVPMQYDDDRYVEVCRARMDSVSRTLQMTSPTHAGKMHNGVFYGPGSSEILYSVDEYFDPAEIAENWRDFISVRPLLHPRSDLALMLPNGKKSGSDSGLSTIAINIPALALQYKYFTMEQQIENSRVGSLLGDSHFIHMYILPNMMGPHLDIVIMNRLLNLYYGKPMGKGYLRHAFRISDYSGRIDAVLNNVIKRVENEVISFEGIINNVPSVFSPTMLDALQMPDMPPTRQIWWSLLLSRLDYMEFLIDIGSKRADLDNLSEINDLKIELKRLKRENILQTVLSRDMYFDVSETIEKILAT